jgi:hypothetical protein
MGSLDSDPGGGKMTHKNKKKSINFIFLSAGCSLLRDEGFSYSLDVLMGIFFSAVFFSFFCSSKPWIESAFGFT